MIGDEESARQFVAKLCDQTAMDRLNRLVEMLAAENERQNLIGRDSIPHMWRRHIADSAQLLTHVPRETTGIWLDLGTGAGFPGMVIATMRPQWPVKLVESRKRRIEWLNEVVKRLGLGSCEVAGMRLEQVESFPASVISARAFAPMQRLIDLSARFSTSDTLWLLPKGRSAEHDLETLPRRLRAMFHVEQSVTDGEAGIVIGHLRQKNGARA
ncbi:MAG: 16S rRNA (guanine(527)-N(7))-methyltransferase RsmG [Novosphingobium sp.]